MTLLATSVASLDASFAFVKSFSFAFVVGSFVVVAHPSEGHSLADFALSSFVAEGVVVVAIPFSFVVSFTFVSFVVAIFAFVFAFVLSFEWRRCPLELVLLQSLLPLLMMGLFAEAFGKLLLFCSIP